MTGDEEPPPLGESIRRRWDELEPSAPPSGLSELLVTQRPAPAPRLTGDDEGEPLWAHRGLVDFMLGGVDDQTLYSAWWEAATRRQMSLTGATYEPAVNEVAIMVNQLLDLSRLPWWADDDLRGKATGEVVYATATGDLSVSSAAAQSAWRRRWTTPFGAPPRGEIASVDPRAAALAEWESWAVRTARS